jgi:hypothetical protein
MPAGRNKAVPPIKMSFWKRDGNLYYADANDLEEAIQLSGHTQDVLKRKLGAGYSELLAALKGKRLGGWTVWFLERGLTPESEHATSGSWHSR